jgi:hypothetical protein
LGLKIGSLDVVEVLCFYKVLLLDCAVLLKHYHCPFNCSNVFFDVCTIVAAYCEETTKAETKRSQKHPKPKKRPESQEKQEAKKPRKQKSLNHTKTLYTRATRAKKPD